MARDICMFLAEAYSEEWASDPSQNLSLSFAVSIKFKMSAKRTTSILESIWY